MLEWNRFEGELGMQWSCVFVWNSLMSGVEASCSRVCYPDSVCCHHCTGYDRLVSVRGGLSQASNSSLVSGGRDLDQWGMVYYHRGEVIDFD